MAERALRSELGERDLRVVAIRACTEAITKLASTENRPGAVAWDYVHDAAFELRCALDNLDSLKVVLSQRAEREKKGEGS